MSKKFTIKMDMFPLEQVHRPFFSSKCGRLFCNLVCVLSCRTVLFDLSELVSNCYVLKFGNRFNLENGFYSHSVYFAEVYLAHSAHVLLI